MNTLIEYATELVRKSGRTLQSGEVFSKVLTENDDSGRHGVLVPTEAYAFFPELPIPDLSKNATAEFPAFDAISAEQTTLGYKYYKRYPERRITRLHGFINNRTTEPRLIVFLHAHHTDGTSAYYCDCANSAVGGRFRELFNVCFGKDVDPKPGLFLLRPVDSEAFSADEPLSDLLGEFDRVSALGWIDSMREGDTGIGYTFETLLGIKENNDEIADFKGIEIKCKQSNEGKSASSGKINLFQAGPVWLARMSVKERIRIIGRMDDDGLFKCYSQITTTPNNLGLSLFVVDQDRKIDLRGNSDTLGYWTFNGLGKRLSEKHARAAFIKAEIRRNKSGNKFHYGEFVYCERPSIERFVALVGHRNIVFEFLMSEKLGGTIRNHGYPWRLIREEFLSQLFSFQTKLR